MNGEELEHLNLAFFRELEQGKPTSKYKAQTQDNLSAKVDWLKLAFAMRPEDLIQEVLGLPLDIFENKEGKLPNAEQNLVYRYSGISVWYLEESLGVVLDISGTGMETLRNNVFYEFTEEEMFAKIIDRIFTVKGVEIQDIWKKRKLINCQRIDNAGDDVNDKPYYTPQKIRKYFVEDKAKFGKNTKISTEVDDLIGGMTFYIGNRKVKTILVRIYDKYKEIQANKGYNYIEMAQLYEVSSWIRTEIEFHGDYADEVLWNLYERGKKQEKRGILNFIKGYLDHKITFTPPEGYDKDEKYRPRFWREFIGNAEEVAIKVPRREPVSFPKKMINWTFYGRGGGMARIIKFMTENNIPFPKELGSEEEMYESAEFSPELIEKFDEYLKHVGRDDLIKEFHDMAKKPKKEQKQ
ncbi:replication initiation factor domain-containing protein [Lactococcus garvieae]|uniref:replication initiation factor domain-containing protein n=1 Tax=Lactococcus garvieae TaxID=1363 RepID=UPI00254FAB98|nr:replication initiation factor domain-containing protein [Lactococcus garvieae]